MTENDLAHDPKAQSVSLCFIALEGFEESSSHLLGYSCAIVCNRDDCVISIESDPDVQVSGVRQCVALAGR
jgi:hypothetical protein